MDQDHLILSPSQAVRAVCLDFKSYSVQTMLFSEILRTLFTRSIRYKRETDPPGLWIAEKEHPKMRWLAGEELVAFMCRLVSRAQLRPEALATLCRRVFQTACRVVSTEDGDWGVVVETPMTGFACRQCGRCCLELDYADGITAADVERLKALGRNDILKWVGVSRDNEGRTVYRMWIEPGTNKKAAACPFLKQGASPDRFVCTIHDVKPEICRNYPVSRKHASLTGCTGFKTRGTAFENKRENPNRNRYRMR